MLNNVIALADNSSADLEVGRRKLEVPQALDDAYERACLLGRRVVDVLSAALAARRRGGGGGVVFFVPLTSGELASVPRALAKLVTLEEQLGGGLDERDRRAWARFVRRYASVEASDDRLAELVRVREHNFTMCARSNHSLFCFCCLQGLTLAEAQQLFAEAKIGAQVDGRSARLRLADFEAPLAALRAAFGAALGVPIVPTTTWADVGGLDDVKRLIGESLRANRASHRRPANARRSGVILHGPPGKRREVLQASRKQSTFKVAAKR